MRNQEPKKRQNGCVTYLTAGGFTGLLSVIVAFLALFIGGGGSGGTPPPQPTNGPLPTIEFREPENHNVSGTWGTEPDYGYVYRFTQSGSYVWVEEVAPNGIVTGYGEGVVSGTVINIDYLRLMVHLGLPNFPLLPPGIR